MNSKLDLFLSTKDYYCELHENFQRAKDSIFIIGWDIHSEVDLLPHKESSIPTRLHPFLNYIAKRNKKLRIYLLPWEHAFFYTLERDIFLEAKFNWNSPSNIKLTTDGTVPIGGSHHQKIVLIDDSVAYCGGTDLTVHRWDDQQHLPHNPARLLSNNKHYPPYHDIQVRCSGEIVQQFSKLVRERYQHATGEKIPYAKNLNRDFILNQECAPIGAHNVKVLVTRPQAIYGKEKREIEQCYLEMIAGAKEFIYIETQYITAQKIRDALCARLQEADCPEIILILPKFAGEWLELETMGRLQYDKCQSLSQSDKYNKLQLLYPDDSRLPDHEYMIVHSKVMIVDHSKCIIGSANLTNRSMGVDSECCIYAEGDYHSTVFSLLSVLTGVDKEIIEKSFKQNRSYKKLIEFINQNGGPRSLQRFNLQEKQHHISSKLIPDLEYLDQQKPLQVDAQLRQYQQTIKSRWKNWQRFSVNWGLAMTLAAVCIITLLLENGATHTLFNLPSKQALIIAASSPFTWAFISLVYFVCGMLFVSINLLIVITATLFQPIQAFLYIMLGAQFYCISSYLLGKIVRRLKPIQFVPAHSNRVLTALKNNSLLTFVMIRIFPLAPSSAIGLVAGYIHASFAKFQLGSSIGLVPGAIALIYFQKSLMSLLKEYDWGHFLTLIIIMLFLMGVYKQARKRFAGYLN